MELLVEPLDGVGGPRRLPPRRRQAGEGEQALAGLLGAGGDGGTSGATPRYAEAPARLRRRSAAKDRSVLDVNQLNGSIVSAFPTRHRQYGGLNKCFWNGLSLETID
ncbi:MAG: hypothetical protein GVY33_13215 [Alphaproteobacteria bacterium]|jgi:hypothetical protein|nr:hypothetical protein [Alphaproteobacteria bacterium]